ncbi:signal peptidase II [Paenibacillus odorifer]|uniref:Lipoprotein signal peptidase n=2 Tax=Paenibacillus TaxID=44249 RepID=A0ABX3HFR4_9BACL|nr:signal peptidase II [Paenibacillus odorifer]
MWFCMIAMVVILIDQVSKIWIRMNLDIGDSLFFGRWEITHYENSGMAFSLFQGYAWLFGVIAILFVIGVFYYRSMGAWKGRLADMIAGFLIGGAVGNGIDRLVFGQVTDFIMSRSGRGILNLADYAINIGMIMLVLNMAVRFVKKRVWHAN